MSIESFASMLPLALMALFSVLGVVLIMMWISQVIPPNVKFPVYDSALISVINRIAVDPRSIPPNVNKTILFFGTTIGPAYSTTSNPSKFNLNGIPILYNTLVFYTPVFTAQNNNRVVITGDAAMSAQFFSPPGPQFVTCYCGVGINDFPSSAITTVFSEMAVYIQSSPVPGIVNCTVPYRWEFTPAQLTATGGQAVFGCYFRTTVPAIDNTFWPISVTITAIEEQI